MRMPWREDVRTLATWLGRGVLSLAGPTLATRQEMYAFIVAELQRREHDDEQRIRPVRVALENQRNDLLAFADVLDDKLSAIDSLVCEVLVLHRLPSTSQAYWQGWGRLRASLGSKFQHRSMPTPASVSGRIALAFETQKRLFLNNAVSG
ncbi:MAG: hypothetical protein JF606_14775 [Burkholderiales bacterium]|nr:hypothetical protein [Burkholderiales bacterium]